MTPKPTKTKEVPSADSQFQQDIAKLGKMANLLRKAKEYTDMDVVCVSTGFPALDEMLHRDPRSKEERGGEPPNVGLVLGRDVEIYSRDPEVGKTSLAIAFIRNFQKKGKRCILVDAARTVTTEYLVHQGVAVDANPQLPELCPLYIARAEADDETPLTAEQVFDLVRECSKIADLVVVDDVPSLIARADLEKDSDENTRTGGISKMVTDHMRRTTNKRATVIWINQQRQKIGFTMPGMPAKYQSMGGMAIPFFGSIRLDLSLREKISIGADDTKEIVGMRINVHSAKNKVSYPFRNVILTYLNEEGFSETYDWWKAALKAGIITKSGAWFNWKDDRLGQGEQKAYKVFKESFLEETKRILEGEDVTEAEEIAEGEQPQTELPESVVAE